jgi:predicted nucleotidyltransferase
MSRLASVAEAVGVNERTLRRAVNEGALRGSRRSPRVLELPLSERSYVRRRWPLLSALRAALRTERNVRFALLFGSAATGEDTEDSDVDVIADLRDASIDRVIDLELKLGDAVGRQVQVIRLDEAEGDPSFLAGALEVGRVLVDRERIRPRLRRREAALRRRGRERDEARKRSALAKADRFLSAGG